MSFLRVARQRRGFDIGHEDWLGVGVSSAAYLGTRHDKQSLDAAKGGAGELNTKGDNRYAQQSTGRSIRTHETSLAITFGMWSGDIKQVWNVRTAAVGFSDLPIAEALTKHRVVPEDGAASAVGTKVGFELYFEGNTLSLRPTDAVVELRYLKEQSVGVPELIKASLAKRQRLVGRVKAKRGEWRTVW